LSAAKVEEELGLRLGRELDAPALGRVVHDEGDGRVDKGSDGLRRKDEAHEVDGRELPLLLVGVARLELAGDRELLADCIQTVGPMSIPMKRSSTGWICSLSVISMKRVALSSRGPGTIASSSSWILASSVMRSTRHISWIWKSTVSRFSKTKDRCRPTVTRRTRLSSMTRSRISARTFSYSRKFRTSFSSIFSLVAEVHDLLYVLGRQLLDVPVHGLGVEPVEHHLEGRTERKAAPAPAADVVDAAKLGVDGIQLPEIRLSDIEGHSDLINRDGAAGTAPPVPERKEARWPRPGPCPRSASGPWRNGPHATSRPRQRLEPLGHLGEARAE